MISPSLIRQQSALLARKPLSVRRGMVVEVATMLTLDYSRNAYLHPEHKSGISISRLRSHMAISSPNMG